MAQNRVLVSALSKQNAVPDGLDSVHHSVSVSPATREAAPRKLSNSMPIARTRTKCFMAVSSFAARFVSKLLAGLTNGSLNSPQGFFKHKPTVGDVLHFAPSGAPPLGQKTDTRVSLDSQLTDRSEEHTS